MRPLTNQVVVTPVTWWQAVALTLLFAVAPAPLLDLLALVLGKLQQIPHHTARLAVASEPLALAWVSAVSVIPPLWLLRQPLPRPPLTQALGIRRVSWRVTLVAVVTGIALQLPLSEVSNLVELIAPVSIEQKRAVAELLTVRSALDALKLTLALVVTAPLCEELLFRGALLGGLVRVHGAALAVMVSAVCFGVAHAGLVTSVLPAALAGLVFGVVALRTGSIVPSMAMHAAVNAVPVLVSRARLEITGFNTLQEGVYHVPLLWLVPSCVIALVGVWWLNRSTRDEHAAVPDPNDDPR